MPSGRSNFAEETETLGHAGRRLCRGGTVCRGGANRAQGPGTRHATEQAGPGRIHPGQDSALRSRHAFSRVAILACQDLHSTLTCNPFFGLRENDPFYNRTRTGQVGGVRAGLSSQNIGEEQYDTGKRRFRPTARRNRQNTTSHATASRRRSKPRRPIALGRRRRRVLAMKATRRRWAGGIGFSSRPCWLPWFWSISRPGRAGSSGTTTRT